MQFQRRLPDTCGRETPLSWESPSQSAPGWFSEQAGLDDPMTVKILGAGSVSEDPIGILRDRFADSPDDSAHADDELELLEFLAADVDPVPADPEFRLSLIHI